MPPLVMHPQTPSSPPLSRLAVIAMTSASNLLTEGHVDECSGFETENIPAAAFRSSRWSSSPWYTAPESCPSFHRASSCSL